MNRLTLSLQDLEKEGQALDMREQGEQKEGKKSTTCQDTILLMFSCNQILSFSMSVSYFPIRLLRPSIPRLPAATIAAAATAPSSTARAFAHRPLLFNSNCQRQMRRIYFRLYTIRWLWSS